MRSPLYSAMAIIKEVKLNNPVSTIIFKLEVYHTIMSFLVSVVHLMDGSFFDAFMGQIYPTYNVPQMLSRKAIS